MKRKLHFLLAVGIGLTASVGWLHAQEINSLEALNTAIGSANSGAEIMLTGDITDANANEGAAITISKAITLNGNGFTISGSASQNIIAVTGTGAVTVKNIVIENKLPEGTTPVAGKGYNDITVFKKGLESTNLVTLESVSLKGNGGIGLVVQGSNVAIDNISVYNHAWGSINLQPNTDVTPMQTPKLLFNTDCKLAGPLQVYTDKGIEGDKSSWVGFNNISSNYTLYTDLPGFNLSDVASAVWSNKLTDTSYSVDFATELQTIVNLINTTANMPVNKILLNNDINISDLYTAQSKIGAYYAIINPRKTITLDGQGHTISGKFLPDDGSKSYYAIKLDGNSAGSTIQNLTIEGTNATALDLITGTASSGSDTTVYVKDVNLYNNTWGGLNVNATAVVAENLHTKGNGHAVRVTVDTSRGTGNANPHFTLKGNSQLEESVKIAYNAKENPKTYNQPALARSIADRLSFVSIETPNSQDWKTTWQMATLSKSFNEDNAVLTWTNELNETALAGKKLANMTNASELDSLFTFGGATVDGIVWTAADKQELTKDITLDKSFAVIGSDSAKCVIKGNWKINATAAVNVVLNKLTLTESESKTQKTSTPMIDVKSNNVVLNLNHVLVNPVAPGTDSDRRACINLSEETITASTIALNNSTFLLTKSSTIGLLVIDARCDFSMENSRIMSNEGVDNLEGLRAILSKAAENSTFNIKNSLLSVGNNFHYAIWVQRPNQHFEINDSQIYGWAAFYMQGAWYKPNGADGITLTARNSSFVGVGKEGASNGFGVIVFEATDNSIVDMENCEVTSKIVTGTKDYGFIPPFIFQVGGANAVTDGRVLKPCSGCHVRLKDCTVQNKAEATTPVMVDYNNICVFDQDGGKADYSKLDGYMDYKNRIYVEGNTQFLNEDGSESIVIQTTDTLRNATKTLPNALVYMNGDIHIPVAYPGDHVMATSIKGNKAVETLNVENAIPTTYTIPDNIIIECKDAYLVTGESAAKAFAEKVSDKAIFYLKQSTSSTPVFATIAVGNNRVKVNANTTWNEATNANRSVEIAAGATLTIDVAMPLDTVFMAEGAQLQANAAVTAKAVQLTYGATKVWKAFGFPFAIGSVTDKENKAVTTAKNEAATGLWTATIDGTKPVFTVTGENATPAATCIIAADKDSTILVTSTTTNNALLSLATKAEPNAPVVTKANDVNFQIYSNPNLSDMTLTQTAYVLSDDGKTFDRMVNPTIKAFQSFVLADEATTNTLRSLRIGDTPTGNEIVPVEGYFVETGHGTITIHTAEPTQVIVVDMLGRVHYNARVNDGAQIAVPAGIYAVNRQKVIVK